MNRVFETPPELRKLRLSKVGFDPVENAVLVAPHSTDSLQVWKCKSLFPCSWKKIIDLPFEEVLFTAFGLSENGAIIGVLTICIQKNENSTGYNHPKVQFYEINAQSAEYRCFSLHESSGPAFDRDVFLDNVIIGHSSRTGWFFYDRSVVRGPIPFWTIILTENRLLVPGEDGTFEIEDKKIPAADENACQRYAVLLDGSQRKFAKFTDQHGVLVFDQATDSWLLYRTAADSDVAFDESRVRGVAETFGRRGHRMGAVESPFTIFADRDSYVAKLYANGKHRFYQITFDDQQRTICFKLSAQVRLPSAFDRTFYPLCTPSEVVFISSDYLTILSYSAPSLRHLSSWSIQQQLANKNAIGAWSGGITETQLKQLCGFRGERLV